jgi:transposase
LNDKTGRDLAAWIGLLPKQNSSGGKQRLGSISRAGNCYLRQMLVVGAMAVEARAAAVFAISSDPKGRDDARQI